MNNLKKSNLNAVKGYNFYEIPSTDKVMFAFHSNNRIDLVGWDDRDIWFRLGDRDDLKNKYLPSINFPSSHNGSDEESRNKYVKKVLKMFA